jgi:hypothetical protein
MRYAKLTNVFRIYVVDRRRWVFGVETSKQYRTAAFETVLFNPANLQLFRYFDTDGLSGINVMTKERVFE